MADISVVGVRLVVEGSQAATGELAAFDAKAKATTESLKEMGGSDVNQGIGRLIVSVENAGRSMDGTSDSSRSLTRAMRDLDGSLSSISSSLTHFAVVGVGGAALGIAGLSAAAVGFGLHAASSFEQSRISFETMLGSMQKGDALFRSLQQFNLKTPFGLPDITAATQTLLQYGFTGDNVLPVLKTLTNVASAAPAGQGSEDLQRQALALGQISSAGVVRGQDINQLTQAGFPIIKLLQQITGQSGEQLQQQLRGGGLTLPASQLTDAIAAGGGSVLSPYANAAERQSHSLSGVTSNFIDNLRMRAATAEQPLVASLETRLPQLGDALGRTLDAVMPQLTTFVTLLVSKAPEAVDKAGPALTRLFDGIERNGPMLITFARDGGRVLGDLAHVGVTLIPFIDDLAGGFHDLLSLPFGIGTGLVTGLVTALLGYNALSGTIKVVRGMADAIDALATAQGREKLSAGLTIGPGGKILGGLGGAAGLGFSGYEAAKNGPSFTNVTGGAASGAILGASIGSVVPGVGTAIGAGAGAVIGGVGTYVLGETQHHHHVAINVYDARDPEAVTKAVDQYYRDGTRRAGAAATP